MPLAHFYDIESLSNVFTLCVFRPETDEIDAYYLSDTPSVIPPDLQYVTDRIYQANHNFRGRVNYFDLKVKENNERMAKTFSCYTGTYMNNPDNDRSDKYKGIYRIVCDSDNGYSDEEYPYFFGYNSFNYDTTIMALYFDNTFKITKKDTESKPTLLVQPPTAKFMRDLNDELFTEKFKNSMPDRLLYGNKEQGWGKRDYSSPAYLIRKNMMMSGRHLDIARLNEKARKVGLKRLLGMMGGQILESDKLKPGQNTIENADQFAELIAYNCSDVIQLKYKLWDHKFYQAQFVLKKGLLTTYPELMYDQTFEKDENGKRKYAPNISPRTVRRDRLVIDSSSAQLATKALCPYGHLKDIPTVSFNYPHPEMAKELGIPVLNVLQETRNFFYANFTDPKLREQFDRIYNYYRQIEGKNFNESDNYAQDYAGAQPYNRPQSLKSLPKTDTTLPYFYRDGTPSSCFVVFSTGGIHGAEYNERLYKSHLQEYNEELGLVRQVQDMYPDPCDLKRDKHVTINDVKYPAGRFLTSGSTLKSAKYKDSAKKEPQLWKEKEGAMALNPKYAFTSADHANHEDFTSYYPNLLRMMRAFWNNGLGYDRYEEIFYQKEDYGVLMKPKNKHVMKKADLNPKLRERYEKLRRAVGVTDVNSEITDAERDKYAVLREGTKLILNSASGAGDATFESNIRMNNQIISMRIIG